MPHDFNTDSPKNMQDPRILEDIAFKCVKICEEKKAANIILFNVTGHSTLADYYLICCGNSLQHIRALADTLRHTLSEDNDITPRQDGSPDSQWIILDYGAILIHLMTPEMRRKFCLEDLWDKKLVVYSGGDELPPDPAGTNNLDAWDEDDEDDDEEDDDWEEIDDDDDMDDDDMDDMDDDDMDDDEDDDDEDDDDDDEDDDDDDNVFVRHPRHVKLPGDITIQDLFNDDDDEDDDEDDDDKDKDDKGTKINVTRK